MAKGNRALKYAVIVRKLEEAFILGASVREACLHADISTDTYYRWIKNNKILSDRLELLKETPIYKARKSVIDSFDEKPEIALKYLERKKKDEFSPRIEHEHDMSDDSRQDLKDIVKALKG